MEAPERELILQMLKNDIKLKRLYDQHNNFEEKLDKLGNLNYLTVLEQQEQKRLKNMKLRGVERMLAIVKQSQQAA